MRRPLPQNIQRTRPFGRLAPRRVWLLPLPDLQPHVRLVHRIAGPALNVPPRIIFDYEFVLVLAGEGRVVFGSRAHPFCAHHLFLIPPFVPHRIETTPGIAADHLAVHFDFAPGVPPPCRALSSRTPYAVHLPEDLALPRETILLPHDHVEQAFLDLLTAQAAQAPWKELAIRACMLRILTALLAKTRAPRQASNAARARLNRVTAHVGSHLADPLTAAGLARVAGLSVSHFNRLFREWSGYSPLDYVRRQRLGEARRLLANIELSIKEIAARTGFSDPYHFSRSFRQMDGLSPTEFREVALAGR